MPYDMGRQKVDFARLPLSERESQILLLAADGLTDKQISEKLGVAEGSIRTYWERVRHKLDAKSRGEAIAKSLRNAFDATLRELAQAQEWARLMVECSHDYAIFKLDVDGTIQSWNPGVAKVLLFDESEFVGQNIEILFTEPDRLAQIPERERETAKELGRSVDDRWHVRRDGTKIWVEGTMVPLIDGDLIGFAKILQDRTEEYQAKQLVQQLIAERAEAQGVPRDPESLG